MDNIKNFGGATLAAGIAAGDTSASVISGQGARLESTGRGRQSSGTSPTTAMTWTRPTGPARPELVRVTQNRGQPHPRPGPRRHGRSQFQCGRKVIPHQADSVGLRVRPEGGRCQRVHTASPGGHASRARPDDHPVAVMSGTVVDVASVNNYKALSTNTTFTWSAVPATDSWFGGRYRNTSGSPDYGPDPDLLVPESGPGHQLFCPAAGTEGHDPVLLRRHRHRDPRRPDHGRPGKAALNLQQSDISGLVSALSGKAASSHTHTASETTDFCFGGPGPSRGHAHGRFRHDPDAERIRGIPVACPDFEWRGGGALRARSRCSSAPTPPRSRSGLG